MEEDTYVSVTKGGYIKRTSPRSYNASTVEEVGKRDDDELIFVAPAKTTQQLLIFTNLGNVIYRPVHELTDIRWKDIGEHLSQTITNFAANEVVLHAEIVDDFGTQTYFAATKMGQIKRFERKELTPWRTYKSKAIKFAKLKSEEDQVIAISPIALDNVMLLTQNGYALRFNIEEVPVVGPKAAGVKAINLKDDDVVVSVFIANTDSVFILTQRGSVKRMETDVIPLTNRANRGLLVLRELKTKPHRILLAGPVYDEQQDESLDLFTTAPEENLDHASQTLEVHSNNGTVYQVILADLSLSERTSNGAFISDTISDEGIFSATVK